MMSTTADTVFSAASAPTQADRACFHCGLPLIAAYPVVVDGASRDTCCRGCQAVAQTIVDSGLASYYRHRSELPQRPNAMPDSLQKLQALRPARSAAGFRA